MKKLGVLLAAVACVAGLASCGKEKDPTYEIAVVTDVGQLMDGGFNQGTYEGAKAYAEKHNKTYQYYAPANGSNAQDADRIAAMQLAIENGAKVIVTPGFLQANAINAVAEEHKDVKFVFVDGWAVGKDNVTAIVYKEEQSGFFAGYGAVMDGYTKLGGVFGGAGSNPACNRFAYGFVQGAQAAALVKDVDVEVKISYNYGSSFSASPELKQLAGGWYGAGTEVIFSCGGSMVNSVISAAEETQNGKVIGVDVDQSGLSQRVITSAVKGLSATVEQVLGQYYAGEWDAKLKDKAQNLGAAENATGLPTATGSWRFTTWTVAEYNTVFEAVKGGTTVVKSEVATDCNVASFWTGVDTELTKVTIDFVSTVAQQ